MEHKLFEDLCKSIREAGEIHRAEGTPNETLETAGCTGGCEALKDGLPDCGNCSQGTDE